MTSWCSRWLLRFGSRCRGRYRVLSRFRFEGVHDDLGKIIPAVHVRLDFAAVLG
jgi:hypothetical protein